MTPEERMATTHLPGAAQITPLLGLPDKPTSEDRKRKRADRKSRRQAVAQVLAHLREAAKGQHGGQHGGSGGDQRHGSDKAGGKDAKRRRRTTSG